MLASENTPSSSGPRYAMRRAARTAQSASGLAPSASARHPAIPDIRPLWQATSLWLEPDAAVEADDLRVHVVILDERAHQLPEFFRPSQPLREHYRRRQPGEEFVRVAAGPGDALVDGRVNDARADRVHPDADDRQVARRGHRHPDDPALR